MLGPLTFGYSNFSDETLLDYTLAGSTLTEIAKYKVKTYSVGLFSDRTEESYCPMYDDETKTLVAQRIKKDSFQAIQYIASKHVTVGLLHNYYLLRELAVTATVFF